MTTLGEPLRLGRREARNRIIFGPHETNLARRRAVSDRHVAYYRERAAGGAGVIVVEEASVHESDWPYERSPLATESVEGWEAVATAVHELGALAVAALGHSGGQGASAYHQRELWAPSRTPDVTTREIPKSMELRDIAAVVDGFASAASAAVSSGLDGIEVNAGQWSLLRQFASGLTNQRVDRYGEDRFLFIAEVLAAVRAAVPDGILGLRMSIDELAPWAGIVPDAGAAALAELLGPSGRSEGLVDYVTVVRGSAYGTGATRPDGQVPAAFGRVLAAAVRATLPREVAVIAQGSIVDAATAAEIVASGEADAVEMTRAQIADPEFAAKALGGEPSRIRPCVLCNQLCQVRDARNPIVSCIGEPRSGHESEDRVVTGLTCRPAALSPRLLVVGGGPAGLECARVAASAGMPVTLLERSAELGGMVASAASRIPGRERLRLLVDWLAAECRSAAVEIVTEHEATIEELDSHDGPIVCCTGSRPGRRSYDVVPPATVLTADEVLAADRVPGTPGPGPSVVWDPIGGPIGVGVATLLAALGDPVIFVTPDFVAAEQLARTGDLAPANVRLQRAGVEIVKHSVVSAVDDRGVTVRDRFGEVERFVEGAILVDAGHRLPEDSLFRSVEQAGKPSGPFVVAGDAVAPRTIHEAILEGRRAALSLLPLGVT